MLAFSAMAAAIWDLESAFAIVQLVFSCWFCLCSSVLRLGRIKTLHCVAARRKTLKNQRILRVWTDSTFAKIFRHEIEPRGSLWPDRRRPKRSTRPGTRNLANRIFCVSTGAAFEPKLDLLRHSSNIGPMA